MRQADVFGAGSGTLFGKMEISNAIRDGKAVILARKSQLDSRERELRVWTNHLSYRLFLRTARLVAVAFPSGLSMPLFRTPRRLGPRGE
jgi:hypothetical protein